METPQLTAQELHDTYRPLWEAVPETRPWICGSNESWMWPINVEHAAAICRVAVEDWLMEQCGQADLHQTHMIKNESVSWWVGWTASDLSVRETSRYATIHHALVAAALAVKGEKP